MEEFYSEYDAMEDKFDDFVTHITESDVSNKDLKAFIAASARASKIMKDIYNWEDEITSLRSLISKPFIQKDSMDNKCLAEEFMDAFEFLCQIVIDDGHDDETLYIGWSILDDLIDQCKKKLKEE